jgi:hypothetical protein
MPGENAAGKAGQSARRMRRSARLFALGAAGILIWAAAQRVAAQKVVGSLIEAPVPQSGVEQQRTGSISGVVADQTGAAIAGARVTLTAGAAGAADAPVREVESDSDGRYRFDEVPVGPFKLNIACEGFATQEIVGVVRASETTKLPVIALVVEVTTSTVQVRPSQEQVAQSEIKAQEKQRVLGVLPNFYVTYVPEPVPLTSKQKFELALRTSVDPVTFGLTAIVAGVEQAQNTFSGYGQGAQGYAKRFGASYVDGFSGTMFGDAIFPSLMKQDPRYYYKGTGSVGARAWYAVEHTVKRKGDNGRWQFNYSGVLGTFTSAGLANLYYPAKNRGVALTFQNVGVDTLSAAATNLLQEFVIKHFTPKLPKYAPANP